MKKLLNLVLILAASGACTALQAANVDEPLPENTYITMNGLDWAWAYPLPASSGIDLSFQDQFGWRLPTTDELQNAPLATDFMFAGANVPLGGTDPVSNATFQATNPTLDGPAACATPYFSNTYNHCDWQDGNGQINEPWAGTPGASGSADQLVVREPLAAQGKALFAVTKSFTDGSESEVDVTLTCNGGLPLQQDFTITGDGEVGVVFVVTDLPADGANCEVIESGSPDGYTPVYNDGNGCAWTAVSSGQFVCDIVNEANPGEFIVTKEWIISEEGGGDDFLESALIIIACDSEILAIEGGSEGSLPMGMEAPAELDAALRELIGDGSLTVSVDTSAGPTSCTALEAAELDPNLGVSGVEISNGCPPLADSEGDITDPSTWLPITAGGSAECTITNTVFFEGIPSLNQYGLAIMALLMLGVGFVGVRRFV